MAVAVGVIATLIASGLVWVFRRQVSQALAALDMSTGAILGWVMAFVIMGVIIVFPLIGVEIPLPLIPMFGLLVGILLARTVSPRK